MPFLVEHGFYALRKTNHIRVVTLQLDIITFVLDANDIYGPDSTGFGRYAVEEWYDLLLVRNSHIQAT